MRTLQIAALLVALMGAAVAQSPSPATPADPGNSAGSAPPSTAQENASPAAHPTPGTATTSVPMPQVAPPPTSQPAVTTPAPPSISFDQVIDLMVDRETRFVQRMRNMHPLVETYIQNVKPDLDLGAVPVNDQYFLGRLDLVEGTKDVPFTSQPGLWHRTVDKLTSIYSLKFLPLGFAQMVMLDTDFDRRAYNFAYVRREFLGEIRCLVIDIQPKEGSGNGRFLGRVWVEDQDYNVVRFNGTYYPAPRFNYYLHFDSWRLNLQPNVWLPAYIYSEESDLKYRLGRKLQFKAQTRLWGYDISGLAHNSEFTDIQVDSPADSVKDKSPTTEDASPLQSQRAWEQQAEENAVDRLQRIGLLAPTGEVDKVLETVVNNLEVTNNLDVEPEVHCRVLLTTPLESFTIGHTIIISRGLIDTLPDEASLAMVLSHELAHIVLGHKLDTKLAFNDRMFFPDEKTFERMDFSRDSREETAADQKAVEMLQKSPYKDKLATPGLYLRMIQERSGQLTALIRPHMGNSLKEGSGFRMTALVNNAPALDLKKIDQIAALPLGGRVKVNPWTNRVELVKSKPAAITSAADKMPLEVTPVFPHLSRFGSTQAKPAELAKPAAQVQ
jgi:hypothetical protein